MQQQARYRCRKSLLIKYLVSAKQNDIFAKIIMTYIERNNN